MKHIHLIGIGGTGLSAIALLLKERGYTVSGSDRVLSPLARQLTTQGITVNVGHDANNIAGADVVVRSSAIPDDNPEVVSAQAAGVPVFKRAEFLGQLMEGKVGIAIAGTHGKTTTTAMIAWVLSQMGKDPSYIIGSESKDLGKNAHAGSGEIFVIEADEYDNMFLGLKPRIEVVCTLEHDHPDCFPTRESYNEAFIRFVQRLEPGGKLVACVDDRGAAWLSQNHQRDDIRSSTYGTNILADYRADDLMPNTLGGFSFSAFFNEQPLAKVELQVPGEHNALNALAVLAVIHELGFSVEHAAAELSSFTGTGRRFDIIGVAKGIVVVDDYAHHPTEVRVTLAAARARYPGRRILAVWQPHTYSRTVTLLNEFIQAFQLADVVVITEVYAAREKGQGFSSAAIVEAMDHPSTYFAPTLSEASRYLLDTLRSGDILLVLSAGDADQVSAQVLAELRTQEEING